MSAALLGGAWMAGGADIGVVPKKLVIDQRTTPGNSKVVYNVTDRTAGITKGVGTDANQIAARLDIAYTGAGGSTAGAFIVPAGASDDGIHGWVTNGPRVARYGNKSAPSGPTEVRTTTIKPGKALKLIAKGRGDLAIDIVAAGSPIDGSVFTAYCVSNAGEFACHCSQFTDCILNLTAGGTEGRLLCTKGAPDDGCVAAPPPICGNGGIEEGERCDGEYFPDTAPAQHGICRTSGAGHDACTFCGDGILQPAAGEECDDGNDIATDNCSATCLERICGDGGDFGPCPAGQACLRDYSGFYSPNGWACVGDSCAGPPYTCVCASSLPAGMMENCSECHNEGCYGWTCPGGTGSCAVCGNNWCFWPGSCPAGQVCVTGGFGV